MNTTKFYSFKPEVVQCSKRKISWEAISNNLLVINGECNIYGPFYQSFYVILSNFIAVICGFNSQKANRFKARRSPLLVDIFIFLAFFGHVRTARHLKYLRNKLAFWAEWLASLRHLSLKATNFAN